MKAFYRLFYYISILLTFILAGFTLAGSFAGNVSPEGSAIFPFIGLALPILLLVNLAVALYWIIRWRYWAFLPLLAVFANAGYISRVLQIPLLDSVAEPAPKMKLNAYTPNILTVVTYNVNSFHHEHTGYSCKEIAASMRHQKADILCFQEFGIHPQFDIDSIRTVLSDWPYYYIPTSPEGTHLLQLAVFSRFPLTKPQLISYPNSNNCSLQCDVEINSRKIRLFNNHLQTTEVSQNKRKLEKELRKEDTQRAERALLTLAQGLQENFRKRTEQATHIRQLIDASPYPALVCGDFNSLPSSYVYQMMKGNKLKDGFQTCGHGYMYTFKYFKHLLRIDYILHSPELKGMDYFSPDWEYSDHNPVVMRVML